MPILSVERYPLVMPDAFSTSSMITELWGKDGPRMMEIAKCESHMNQFRLDGSTVRSYTDDWGFFQINARSWDKDAKDLGLDYKGSVIDNIKMAKYVWDRQGFNAWVCNRMI